MEDEIVSWINVVIIVLFVIILICALIGILLKKRLGSIDGMIGITKMKEYKKIIGGNPSNYHAEKKQKFK